MASTHIKELLRKSSGLPVIQPDAAGIDIGSTLIAVCVPEDRDEMSVRTFGAFTDDLVKIASWLKSCGIKTVAMESTGIYWMPLYDLLEENGFEVCLVNAYHFKNVKGKTDVKDSRWLQRLHSVGVLSAGLSGEDCSHGHPPPRQSC
jgi:transposase